MCWRIKVEVRAALAGLGVGGYGCRKVLTFFGESKLLEVGKHVLHRCLICLPPCLVSEILLCRAGPFRIRESFLSSQPTGER